LAFGFAFDFAGAGLAWVAFTVAFGLAALPGVTSRAASV
jgi:hypothetical protein